MHIRDAVRQTKGVKVDVRTLEGTPVTWRDATLPIGSALRIVPAFTATAVEEGQPISTTIEAHYSPNAGRYLVGAVTNRAADPEIDINGALLRKLRIQELLQQVTPRCLAIQLEDDADPVTVDALTTGQGRLLPKWMAEQARTGTDKVARMEMVTLIYAVAVLSNQPPIKALQAELGIPHRTAADWIMKARAGGLLDGMHYIAGRPADA